VVTVAGLFDSGVPAGTVEIVHSLLPLLTRAALIAAASAVIALLVFVPIRLLPLRALARSEEQLGAVSRTAPDAIIAIRADGTIRSWNPAAARIFGLAEADALGRALVERVGVHGAEHYVPGTTSFSARPGSCRMEQRKFTSARWCTTTPLGHPVEPEV
jgi:PAS domain-containing protein